MMEFVILIWLTLHEPSLCTPKLGLFLKRDGESILASISVHYQRVIYAKEGDHYSLSNINIQ